MKKSILFAVLCALVLSATAQEMKVQSAYSDMKNGRLSYAKKNIDDACKHEKTMGEAKTWAYAGLIYSQIVQAMNDENASKSTKKQLKEINESAEVLCQQGIENVKKAIDLEKKAGTHEYLSISMETYKALCAYEYMYVGEFYDKGNNYEESAKQWAKVIEDATAAGQTKMVNDAMYYQANCYRILKQTDKEFELYRTLAKNNTTRYDVYLRIYQDNKDKGDTTKALNALKKGVKMTANDTTGIKTNMKVQLANAYTWAGKTDEANKILDEMVAEAGNNPVSLNGVASIYADQGDLVKAEEYYNKSLTINPQQSEALNGLGNAYFNKGLKEQKVADKIPLDDVEAYDTKIKEVYVYYEKAIPFFEKVLTVEANNFNALNRLRVIYSIFNARTDATVEMKKSYQEKFKYYDAEVKKLTAR